MAKTSSKKTAAPTRVQIRAAQLMVDRYKRGLGTAPNPYVVELAKKGRTRNASSVTGRYVTKSTKRSS